MTSTIVSYSRNLRGRSLGWFEELHRLAERPRNGNRRSLDDHIDRCSWNKLIDKDGNAKIWTGEEVATFPRLIDRRTLLLSEILMEESGITKLIDIADGLKTSPEASAHV